MLEFLEKLEAIKKTLKKGAGRLSDVLQEVEDVVRTGREFLDEVEGGQILAADAKAVSRDNKKLEKLAVEFHAIAAGPKVAAAKSKASADAKLSPGVALLIAEIIKLILERRKNK